MTGPDAGTAALSLYLDAASRLVSDSRVSEAREALEAAAVAYKAAEATYRAALADRDHALSDVRAAVELGREAGLREPDPLGLLLAPPPLPDLEDLSADGTAPEDPEPLVLQEEPEVPEPKPVWRRSAPGESLLRAYRALDSTPRFIEDLTERAGGGGPGKGGAVASALVHLGSYGLAERIVLPREGKAGNRTQYRLADPRHLPISQEDFVDLRALDRTGRREEAIRRIDALREAAEEPDPAPVPPPERKPRPLPPYAPGALVRAWDPEKHHYRIAHVRRVVRHGARRGDLLVAFVGADREAQVSPDRVKPPEPNGAEAL